MSERKTEFTRRKFIGTSLTCLASAGIASVVPGAALAQSATTEPTATSAGTLPVRTLGRTGMKVPVISMGAGAAGDPGLVQAAYEIGIRHFDTAASYAYGRNEQMVGNVLNKMAVREKANIGTKLHTSAQRQGVSPEKSKSRLIKTLEGCLKRLKTDYVDILYVHDVSSPDDLDDATTEAMIKVKEQGKTRAIGLSTHSGMTAVINGAIEQKVWDVVLTSFNFTFAGDAAMMKAVRDAAAAGIGIIAMKTQAGGANFPNPETLRNYSVSTINRAALKWVLRNEAVTTAIPGLGNHEHIRENFATGTSLDYTEEEERFLNDNSIQLGFEFCRQCKQCLASCPNGVDVPTLMRTHMYAAQYADFAKARRTLDQVSRGLTLCGDCASCVANCANSVNIPRKIQELKTIYA